MLSKRVVSQLLAAANEVVAKLHEVAPDEVPEITIPNPEQKQTELGELFFLPRSGDGRHR